MDPRLLALLKLLPESWRLKALFRLGVSVVPMMRYVRASLVELTDEKIVIRIDRTRRTKNAYNSLFIGAFCVGGDCAAGLFPMKFMFETGHRTPPIVRTASAEYFKRVNSYAHFTCTQGRELYDLCKKAVSSGERHEVEATVVVTAPEEFGDEPVAKITQVMSVRVLGTHGGTRSSTPMSRDAA